MKPNGNVLRVVSATSDNAGNIVCEGKTERGLMFAAKGQLKVIGITHHFTNIHHCNAFSYKLQEYNFRMCISCN